MASSRPSTFTRQVIGLVVTATVLFLLGFLIGYFTSPNDESDCSDAPRTIGELRRDEIQKKEEYHSKLYESLNRTEIGKNLKYFSKRPHVPGTPRSKELADEIAKVWKEYQFDKVEMPKYNVLLPYVDPNISNKVQVLDTGNNTVLEFSGKEKVSV